LSSKPAFKTGAKTGRRDPGSNPKPYSCVEFYFSRLSLYLRPKKRGAKTSI